MSVTTTIIYESCSCFDMVSLVKNGELTLSTKNDLMLLDQGINNYGITGLVTSESDPVGIIDTGKIFLNVQTGTLFFGDGTTNHKVGVIQQRTGINAISRSVSSPPSSPQIGDQYIIPGSGSWGGNPYQLVQFSSVGWLYIVPALNQRCGVMDESVDYVFNGSSWIKDINSVWLEAVPAST